MKRTQYRSFSQGHVLWQLVAYLCFLKSALNGFLPVQKIQQMEKVILLDFFIRKKLNEQKHSVIKFRVCLG